MSFNEEKLIRDWLALIEETDPITIAEVIGKCKLDADACAYFVGRATENRRAITQAGRDAMKQIKSVLNEG